MVRKAFFLKVNEQTLFRLRLLFMAALIFGGILLGIAAAGHTGGTLTAELSDYLSGYLRLENQRGNPMEMLLSTMFAYFRFPLLAVLLGFASLGVVLIPLLCVILGFLPAFSVSSLTIAFGGRGALLAAGMIGLRSLITIFCFLLLGVPALGTSASLASLTFGSGRRVKQAVYGRDWWLRVLLCAVLLVTAMCVDILISPGLLSRLAENIL